MGKLTPMMEQYARCKAEHPDALLFFRLGDFYEMFAQDALTASRELELTLTSREGGEEGERTPMCGVPWHAVDGYIHKLVEKGYRVAIAEQMTDPAESRGLVEREVVRVITPGTITESSMLDEKSHNYMACLHMEDTTVGLCVADVSTGYLAAACLPLERAMAELQRLEPSEVLVSPSMQAALARMKGLHVTTLVRPDKAFELNAARGELALRIGPQGFEEIRQSPLAVQASGALMDYLRLTQKKALSHLKKVEAYRAEAGMTLDAGARRNLELTQSLRGRGRRGTLLWVLDQTKTAMGGRLIKEWIEQPLGSAAAINRRLDAVQELTQDALRADELSSLLVPIQDIERLCTKLSYGTFNARDAHALGRSVAGLPRIRALAGAGKSALLCSLHERIDELQDVSTLIEAAVDDDPPFAITDGGIFRTGYAQELDELRAAAGNGKEWIAQLEAREREETGIKNLKIGFNRVFGYYIEVTRSYFDKVPYRYTRKQTLAGCERFITEELKQVEERVLGAEEKAMRLEHRLFVGLRETVAAATARLQATARALAELDCLLSLAAAAALRGYQRPQLHEGRELRIAAGRHPVVEAVMEHGFVPNDTHLTAEERFILLTGPNMSGKSTIMRQVALIAIMAHIGSFVPAHSASIPLLDRVFTRIGAQDDLSGGQSTFMVEMSEVADILRFATNRSLILLDEVGRGTSTFDGLSIAWALVERIASPQVAALSMFATHYHELCQLEGQLPGVVNYSVSAREMGEDVIFLHRMERGGTDRSFGIQVAALAGLPAAVLNRAREVLARLEAAEVSGASVGQVILEQNKKPERKQMDMASVRREELLQELRGLDVTAITPMEAMNRLFALREQARLI